MTVYIEKPALNLREELASLRNQGGYQEQQFYFDGLVTNGTFDADTDWTKGAGWTIGSGVASASSATSGLYQALSLTVGAIYAITFTVSTLSAGSVKPQIIGGTTVNGTSRNSTGTYTEYLVVAEGNIGIQLVGASFTGTVDNVSVFTSDGTDVIHTMPQGWKPKDFYEDGLLQREGAANDYEVVFDGFDYSVKPAVAPSATTQSCVIGVKS
jgi:hypothetical protein